jgi:transcriptional regulator with XRE-family HTH domain
MVKSPAASRPVEPAALKGVDQFVGEQLTLLRMKAGVSQTELAELLCVPVSFVEHFEAGAKRIGATQLFKLAGHLNVPVATFFGIELEVA